MCHSYEFQLFRQPSMPPPSTAPLPVATDLSNPKPAHFETPVALPPRPTVPRPVSINSSTWKPQTDKPYMCSKCGKGLSHIFTLNRHRKTVCGKVRNTSGKWKCEHCTRSYKTEGNLARHTRYECGVPRQFYCVFCQRAFTQRCSLSRHLRNFHKFQSYDGSAQRELDPPGNDSDSAYGSFSSDRNQNLDGLVAQRELDPPGNDSDSTYGSAVPSLIVRPSKFNRDITQTEPESHDNVK